LGGPFSQDIVETVRDAGDIVRLISDYVPLKPAGSRMKGLCPFHEEKTPSFSVDPERQLFYCFGCQTGGDVFKFVMLYEKLGFREAIEFLAQRWGVALPTDPGRPAGPEERLAQMNQAAAAFYRKLLRDEESGARCRAYLEGRGIRPEVVEQLDMGLAPDSWEALRHHLSSKGFSAQEMLAGGLILSRKSGSGHYDRFRNRLMFPIRDVRGKTVAFGGRTLADDDAKYINSPETPVYTKGNHLYGLDLSHTAIRHEGMAIVVEGYLDLVALLQAGFENVVASLGTAFTPQQAKLLARYTDRVVVSYDGDAAGAQATVRSLDLLLQKGFDVRVVELPAGMDPDDFIRAEGAEAYATRLRRAPKYLEFMIRREARRDLDRPEEQVAGVNAVLPHIARLTNSIERAFWVSRLADAMRIEEGLVRQELQRSGASAQTSIRHRPPASTRLRDAEARLVSLLLRSEDDRHHCSEAVEWRDLEGTQIERIVRTILQMAERDERVDHPAVLAALEDDVDRGLLARIAFRDEPNEGPTVQDCLNTFRRQRLAREGRAMLREIGKRQQGETEPAADTSAVDRQLARLQELARQRDQLM
jgi:DNA primase